MVVATGRSGGGRVDAPGVATLLMKRTPFTDAEITTIEKAAAAMNFDLMTRAAAVDRSGLSSRSPIRAVDGPFIAGFPEDLSRRPTIARSSSRWIRTCFSGSWLCGGC